MEHALGVQYFCAYYIHTCRSFSVFLESKCNTVFPFRAFLGCCMINTVYESLGYSVFFFMHFQSSPRVSPKLELTLVKQHSNSHDIPSNTQYILI